MEQGVRVCHFSAQVDASSYCGGTWLWPFWYCCSSRPGGYHSISDTGLEPGPTAYHGEWETAWLNG